MTNGENQPTRLWGGRFGKAPDPRLTQLSNAAEEHARLVPYDVLGSLAHASALERAGLISKAEAAEITATLTTIAREFRTGKIAPAATDEDIHTFLERQLVERLGDTGGKLRAGRSRNDQAANNLKLYLRDEARRVVAELGELIDAIALQATRHSDAPCPGFTHLQAAQPVTFGHWLLAHAQALARDATRFRDAHSRMEACPLGAAAMAGSALTHDTQALASALGYSRAFENSVDAVSARDHVAEFLFAAAMTATNLSRLAEEITLWASAQFRWIALDDAFATGSSIMPQKKNPDIAEISRGRSARLVGDLVTMLGAIKGLPLSYNRDLAEDKRAAFDAVDVLHEILPAFAGMVATMRANTDQMRRQAATGFTLATEVADYLARKGVPFAEAHEITGRLVSHCEEKGCDLDAVDDADLARIDARLAGDLRRHLTIEAAIAARSAPGGTAPHRVREQAEQLQQTIAGLVDWAKPNASA